jgi:hypothetical protein
MAERVGVRELRQNLSRYLDRVKAGEPRPSDAPCRSADDDAHLADGRADHAR